MHGSCDCSKQHQYGSCGAALASIVDARQHHLTVFRGSSWRYSSYASLVCIPTRFACLLRDLHRLPHESATLGCATHHRIIASSAIPTFTCLLSPATESSRRTVASPAPNEPTTIGRQHLLLPTLPHLPRPHLQHAPDTIAAFAMQPDSRNPTPLCSLTIT
jgi:hypothetical protein